MDKLFLNSTLEEIYILAFNSVCAIIKSGIENNEDIEKKISSKRVALRKKSKKEMELFKLKYVDCLFKKIEQYACRGITFCQVSNIVHIVPNFNKFFSAQEWQFYNKIDYLQIAANLEKKKFSLILMPKYDGSNVQVFADHLGKFHVYTLGSLDKNSMRKSTFHEKTMKMMEEHVLGFLLENPYTSITFEIVTSENRIITSYQKEFLMPLTMNRPGCMILDQDFNNPIQKEQLPTWEGLERLFPEYVKTKRGVRPAVCWETSSRTIENDILDIENELIENPKKYGIVPEGLVCFAVKKTAIPFLKHKTEAYKKAENPKEHDPVYALFQIQRYILGISDVADCPENPEFVEVFNSGLSEIATKLANFLPNLRAADNREYSKIVESLPKHMHFLRYALYKNRNLPDDLDILNKFVRDALKFKKGNDKTVFDVIEKDKNPFWFIE